MNYMKQEAIPDFIVIDDDSFSNLICHKMIELTIPEASVKTFTDPQQGLVHILSTYTDTEANNAVIFLDINMPTLSGWEILDQLTHFTDLAGTRIKIFMLSSSVDTHDKEKVGNNPLVSGYIIKSISHAKLQLLYPAYTKTKIC
jgi:two-component system chemotaxis response regulator CheY